jgi:uncharacterized protein YlaI
LKTECKECKQIVDVPNKYAQELLRNNPKAEYTCGNCNAAKATKYFEDFKF